MPGSVSGEAEVSAERAAALTASGEAWLLDVREQYEWDAGHAPGAHHIPMREVGERVNELPDDERILVICHVGGRSALVTDALRRAQYDAANVAGGMEAWQQAGASVVREGSGGEAAGRMPR
jgi:rhodanese-related sulfurtransferase